MFGKVMRLSDDLMYRYYELLTDLQLDEITALRRSVQAGERDPMEVKMALGQRIVADFHSEAEAIAASEAFNREVRQGLEPADTETVDLPAEARTEKGIRVDKLIAKIGLTESVSDAVRKVEAGAVEINGVISKDRFLPDEAGLLVVRVGKKWKRVRIS
jgi:tyrosyl-tRNA synthetase